MKDFGDIIDKNAVPSSIKRGKSLYAKRRVLKIRYRQFDNAVSCEAFVNGTGNTYKTTLKVVDNELEDLQCTCPYDWEGICKHQVATILQLRDELAKDSKPRNTSDQKKRNTKDPYEISMKYGLDLTPFANNLKYGQAQGLMWGIKDLKLDENKIFIVVPNNIYWSKDFSTVAINISKDGQSIYITSHPPKRAKELSSEELAALIYIYNHDLENILHLTLEGNRDEFILSEAKKYGIQSLEKAKQYFEIGFHNKQFTVKLKASQVGLMPIFEGSEIVSSLNRALSHDWFQEKSLLSPSKNTAESRGLFFYFHRPEYENPFNILSVVPFVARKKSNGEFYKTGIKPYFGLAYHEVFDLNDLNASLVALSKATIPSEFSKRFSNAIRRIDNELEKRTFIYNQNLKQLSNLWDHFLEINNEFYLNFSSVYHNRLSAGDFIQISLIPERPVIEFELSFKNDMVRLVPLLRFSSKKYRLGHSKLQWVHPVCGKIEHQLFLLRSAEDALFLDTAFKERKSFLAVPGAFKAFFHNYVAPISKNYPVKIVSLPKGIEQQYIQMKVSAKKLYMKELDQFILMRPFLCYGEHEVNVLDQEDGLILNDNKVIKYQRDLKKEQGLIGQIKQLHPKFQRETNQNFYSLHIDEFIEDYWFLKVFQTLQEQGIEVYGFNDFKNFNYSPYTPKVQVNAASGVDWFDLEVSVTVGDAKISLKEVRKAVLSKEKYIKLGNGKLAVLPQEWIKKLEKFLRIGRVEKDKIQVSKLRFNALDEIFEELDQEEILNEITEKKTKLKSFRNINTVPLPEVQASLRDYQKDGFQWLHFLQEFGWGGILADDMGLGKTLQIITFLKTMVQRGIKKNLVVVPTSLLFNWQNEIEKFCPSLSYHVYHGSKREKEEREWDQYDLIITTYGLLVSDIEIFRKVQFGFVILDESQAIKNPLSKRFKAAVVLKAHNKITMTGTPIENSTLDLYAQMTFVNPGIFISLEHFKKAYANPIDRDSDQETSAELNKIIHPFILRRTKEMVAKELPPKTEDVIYCRMEEDQRKVYDAFCNKYRNKILGLIEEEGLEKSKLHILQALTKLRQICNSPALLNEDSSYGSQSVKIKELVRHIREKTGHHKLLVFSQFVSMLGLIRKELEKLEIPYAYLDGRTRKGKREEAVNIFQNELEVRVFLISLKAGGTGLNLTAADYVYIVDPWWNPAVENQAIDRCYRIGQDKKVIAYRMICKDTLEEKIMSYKTQKQSVADAIIKTDEHVMKQISKEDIMDLLS